MPIFSLISLYILLGFCLGTGVIWAEDEIKDEAHAWFIMALSIFAWPIFLLVVLPIGLLTQFGLWLRKKVRK